MSKNTTISLSVEFDEEKLNTLNVYLMQNDTNLNTLLADVLKDTIDKQYSKVVPQQVQVFINIKNGIDIPKPETPPNVISKKKEQKPPSPVKNEMVPDVQKN